MNVRRGLLSLGGGGGGLLSEGDIVFGGECPGGYCPRVLLPSGVNVRGVMSGWLLSQYPPINISELAQF